MPKIEALANVHLPDGHIIMEGAGSAEEDHHGGEDGNQGDGGDHPGGGAVPPLVVPVEDGGVPKRRGR